MEYLNMSESEILAKLIIIEAESRSMGMQMRKEAAVARQELADRQRKGLTGDAAIAHYNEWMQRYGMEHLMVIPRNYERFMNGIIDTLEMYVPDVISAKLTLDKVLARADVERKVLDMEPILGGMVLHYSSSGRNLELLYSPSMKKRWNEKGIAGSKVRYIQRDVKGNIIEDMCREGVLMSGGTFFVSCDRCVSVSFGSGSEAYDITTIEILEQ